ncbi:MAG: hypothetical protein IVW53_15035 [Chloroflexi bacterium]|nr:hypothetical protein [Chloroflexota bacterium]
MPRGPNRVAVEIDRGRSLALLPEPVQLIEEPEEDPQLLVVDRGRGDDFLRAPRDWRDREARSTPGRLLPTARPSSHFSTPFQYTTSGRHPW